MQVPLVHVCPWAQTTPQLPQFRASLLRLVQTPAQTVCPLRQPAGGALVVGIGAAGATPDCVLEAGVVEAVEVAGVTG